MYSIHTKYNDYGHVRLSKCCHGFVKMPYCDVVCFLPQHDPISICLQKSGRCINTKCELRQLSNISPDYLSFSPFSSPSPSYECNAPCTLQCVTFVALLSENARILIWYRTFVARTSQWSLDSPYQRWDLNLLKFTHYAGYSRPKKLCAVFDIAVSPFSTLVNFQTSHYSVYSVLTYFLTCLRDINLYSSIVFHSVLFCPYNIDHSEIWSALDDCW